MPEIDVKQHKDNLGESSVISDANGSA